MTAKIQSLLVFYKRVMCIFKKHTLYPPIVPQLEHIYFYYNRFTAKLEHILIFYATYTFQHVAGILKAPQTSDVKRSFLS